MHHTVEDIEAKLKLMEVEAQAALASFGMRFSDDPSYHLQWAMSTYHAAAQAHITDVVLKQMTMMRASGVKGEALHQALQGHCIKELCILANASLTEPATPTMALYMRSRTYVYGQLVDYFYGHGSQ